jgi:hypothetical protein
MPVYPALGRNQTDALRAFQAHCSGSPEPGRRCGLTQCKGESPNDREFYSTKMRTFQRR